MSHIIFFILISLSAVVVAEVPRFAFTANSLDNTISTFSVDADTGRLNHLSYIPTFKNPSSLRVSKDGSFLYVASQTIDEIRVFKINKNSGELTWLESATVPSNTRSTISTALSKKHDVLFMPGRFTANLVPFGIDSKSGRLTPLMRNGVDIGYQQVRYVNIHPSEKYIYTTSHEAGLLSVLQYNPVTKKLLSIQEPVKTGSSPQEILVHPNGKYVYVTNYVSSDLSVFGANSLDGRLTPLTKKTKSLGLFPLSGVVHPSGRFVYIANRAASKLSAFRVDSDNGTLSAFQNPPETLDALVIKLKLDRAGDYLYALSNYFDTVTSYKIDTNSGAFLSAFRIKSRRGVKDIDFMYAKNSFKRKSDKTLILNYEAKSLSLLQFDPRGESSRVLDTITFKARPSGFVYSRFGHLIFVADKTGNSVTVFRLDSNTFKLSQVPGPSLSLPASPIDLSVDMNGRYLYILTANPDVYAVYEIDIKSGTLHGIEGMPFAEDAKLSSLVIGPSGQNSVVTLAGLNKVSFADFRLRDYSILKMFRSDATLDVGRSPVHSVVDATSRFLYVANRDSDNISGISMPRQQDGQQNVKSSPFHTGKKPVFLAIHPSMPLLYCINQLDKSISRFRINESSGELTELLPRFNSQKAMDKMVIHANGKMAYVLDKMGENVFKLSINPDDGSIDTINPLSSLHGSTDMLLLEYFE